MKGITWSRDSHGLFDYESRHLTKKTMRTDQPVIIMRRTHELHPAPYNSSVSFPDQVRALTRSPQDDRALLKIVNHHDSTFYLESANWRNEKMEGRILSEDVQNNLNENMYLVVRSLKHNNEKIVSKTPSLAEFAAQRRSRKLTKILLKWSLTIFLICFFAVFRTTKCKKETS